jgi:hypothetical protein
MEELGFRSVVAEVASGYRTHWRVLLLAGLVVFVPLGLLEVVGDHLQEPLDDESGFDAGTIAAVLAAIAGVTIGTLVGEVVYTGIVSALVADAHEGRERRLREVLPHIKLGRLISIDLLWAAVVVAGFVALVVPGVLFMTWFALVAPAAELEDRGVIASFRRSRELVRRRFWLVLAFIGGLLLAEDLLTRAAAQVSEVATGDGFAREWVSSTLTNLAVAPLYALAAVTLFLGLRKLSPRVRG